VSIRARHGSKTSRIRIYLRLDDGGLSSFMFATREAVIESTSSRPPPGRDLEFTPRRRDADLLLSERRRMFPA